MHVRTARQSAVISEKLVRLLQQFTKYELNQFKKFVNSPYFNEQEELIKLFELCNSALRREGDTDKLLDKLQVWRKLYPGRVYDDAHLRRLSSELTHLALEFLALEKRKKKPVSGWLEQQRLLDHPALTKHLAGVERQIQRYWEDEKTESPEQYFERFQLHWNIYDRARKTMSARQDVEKLLSADHYLDAFYLVQKLKSYCNWLTFQRHYPTDQPLSMPEGFYTAIAEPKFQTCSLIVIYRHILLCLTEPETEAHFYNLLDSLNRYADKLTEEELRECYTYAQNYCALKINAGLTEYYLQMHHIHKVLIDKNIMLENGLLSEGFYKNVITVSLGVNEYEWAESFIQQYACFLPASIRENARIFNLSYLYFHQKQHERVIQLLQNVEYNSLTYILGSKLILLRTYYELAEYLVMDSLIESFRIYIRRNKLISKELKKEYTTFLMFLKKLSAVNARDVAALDALRQQILNSKQAGAKKWLLEKVDELYTR